MIKTILAVLVIFMALALIAAWVLSGSFGRIAESTSGFTNLFRPGTSTVSLPTFSLPWQIPLPQGPSVGGDTETDLNAIEEDVAGIEQEFRDVEHSFRQFNAPPPQSY